MARQLRIEYPGAFYHVTSRGNQKSPIFFTDYDKAIFLGYCQDAHSKFEIIVHSYCLMENHYHLLMETPQGNLAQTMHFVNSSYAMYFNRKHARVGHLLQGRFKAILVEADAYAQVLSRYIHLNPVRSGLANLPEDYSWSSYREYLGQRTPPAWLSTGLILGYFGNDPEIMVTRYQAYVRSGMTNEQKNVLSNAGRSLILGSEEFVARIGRAFVLGKTENRDIPAIRAFRERTSLSMIRTTAERTLRTQNNLSRNVTIFLGRKRTNHTLKEIAEFFEISVSATQKIQKQMIEYLDKDKVTARAVQQMETELFG